MAKLAMCRMMNLTVFRALPIQYSQGNNNRDMYCHEDGIANHNSLGDSEHARRCLLFRQPLEKMSGMAGSHVGLNGRRLVSLVAMPGLHEQSSRVSPLSVVRVIQ